MKPKTKIPAVVTAYLKRAPKFAGFRLLKPTEVAKRGDRFFYLHSELDCPYLRPLPTSKAYDGYIRVGRTLLEARRDGIERWGQYTEYSYDGVIYRPIKRKSAKK